MGTATKGHNRWRLARAPGLAVLRGYRRAWLRGDLIAGVTVAAYLVPQVMAYAVVAGLPPVTGLWAALPALACYAVLGSSRLVSLGPESTTALMTAVAIGPLAAGNPSRYAALAAMLALLVGLLAVVAWLVRLGFLADLLSRPVLVGYLAGVALIMMAGQLGRLTGVRVAGESFIAQVVSVAGRRTHVTQVHLGQSRCRQACGDMPHQRHAVPPQAEDRADGGAQQHGDQRPGNPGPPGLRGEQEHEHRRGDRDVTRIHLRQPAGERDHLADEAFPGNPHAGEPAELPGHHDERHAGQVPHKDRP